jgi:tetratricopeptide (TPR) repeat protein
LYELLGGPPLIAPDSFRVPSPQEFAASIPPRVEGLIRKCLAREPEKRYTDAGSLAIDLRRCLIELPSAGPTKRTLADGSSPRGKLLNRPAAVVVLVAAVAMFAVAAANFLGRVDQGEAGQVANRDRLALQRQRTADELHTLVDHLRFLDGLESLPADRLRKLEAGCSEVCRARSRLTNQATAPLAPDIERRVRTDLLELAVLWGDLHVRLAPAEQLDQARREAVQALTQAEAELGSSVVLSMERQTYAEALGLSDEARRASDMAAQLEPHTVWEHYAIGRFLLRAGKREAASAQFQRAVDLEPQAFWPNFYAGTCAYRLQQYEAALAAFSACVALAPDKAECFHNRGLAYQALGREALAARDFECARRLDSFARR